MPDNNTAYIWVPVGNSRPMSFVSPSLFWMSLGRSVALMKDDPAITFSDQENWAATNVYLNRQLIGSLFACENRERVVNMNLQAPDTAPTARPKGADVSVGKSSPGRRRQAR